jgi:DNA-binding NarL/FixJ family response regulator
VGAAPTAMWGAARMAGAPPARHDSPCMEPPIRVVVVDDHPAMRAGLRAVLHGAPDLEATGEAGSGRELWPVLDRTAPDVVLLDLNLPDTDGFSLCSRLKRMPLSPRVVLYTAYANPSLAPAAALAQADGLLAKSAPSTELCRVVRAAARGAREVPPVRIEDLAPVLEPADRPLAEALLAGASPADAARAAGVQRADLGEHVNRLLRRTLASV